MIVFIMTIHFLEIIFSTTTQDISNIRYNPLISAQCKARCLYEYRNHSQQHRSFSSMFTDGKTKRLLVSSFYVVQLTLKICIFILSINLFDKQKISNLIWIGKIKKKRCHRIQVLPILIYSRQCFCYFFYRINEVFIYTII